LAVSQLERCNITPAGLWTLAGCHLTETPRMTQYCGLTAAVVVVSRDPTNAPRTPATSPDNKRHVHLSAVCPR